jgi:hypothetical protein
MKFVSKFKAKWPTNSTTWESSNVLCQNQLPHIHWQNNIPSQLGQQKTLKQANTNAKWLLLPSHTGSHGRSWKQKALEKQMGFNYRQVIGDAIIAMTLCQLDIAPAIIKLSQFATNPAQCYYQAAKVLMVYLNATRVDGIFYWCPEPYNNLPDLSLPATISSSLEKLHEYPNCNSATELKRASGSTSATDRQHWCSTGGVVFFYTGGAIHYRSCIHPTVAQSSTEAKPAFMTDAGKAALYLQSILEELHLEQLAPTKIAVDNRGARQLTNAQQPTKRTWHIGMRDFCILQWTEEEQILYSNIPSALNVSDSLSKPMGRIKFYEQMDILMGQRCPSYVNVNHKHPKHTKYESQNDLDNPELDNPEVDNPASPYHINGSTCFLSDLSIYSIDYEDLDCFDLDNVHSFDATKGGGGVIGMTSRTKLTLRIHYYTA